MRDLSELSVAVMEQSRQAEPSLAGFWDGDQAQVVSLGVGSWSGVEDKKVERDKGS